MHNPDAYERLSGQGQHKPCTCSQEQLDRYYAPSIIGRIYFWLIVIVVVTFLSGLLTEAIST
ncbi:hypothetical protein WDZ16_10445 [Pseudokineococcus marinus]|uniref:Uncharacterized protein n=1 Tax=Pseudokineococcus marinus TaxID=351215 RepID=A0A849BJ28_9ACTN|nr:hypothetical protein [Pseudokineococcus marinus]NNH22621.1 hypothetical protein [Pseudokineococcus marinus]